MRQGPSNRRARGRGNPGSGRRGNLPNRNQTFDSNGPDVRIRGTAFQVNEKYQALARDASVVGDRIMAENYLQHAEHYHRIITAINEAAQNQSQQPDGREARDGGHRQRDGGNRDGGNRDNGNRDNGNRDANSRENSRDNGHRESGHRESGNREAGQRDNGARENGARDAASRENGHQVEKGSAEAAAPLAEPELEFGEDPRQDDARDAPSDEANGESTIDVIAVEPAPATKPAKSTRSTRSSKTAEAASAANGAAAEEDGAAAPKPRRRGPGRPRKTSVAKDSPAPEANPDAD